MDEQLTHIKDFLRTDDIDRALNELAALDLAAPFGSRLIHQQRRFNALEDEVAKGTLTYQEIGIERSKISDAILMLITAVEQYEAQTPAKKWVQKYRIQLRIFLAFFLVTLLIFSAAFYAQMQIRKETQRHIQKLDREISNRIVNIDIPNWYKASLLNKKPTDLQRELLGMPEEGFGFQEEFKNMSLRALMEMLYDKVGEAHKQEVADAISQLGAIEKQYDNGLLEEDTELVYNFAEDLLELNAIRWEPLNQFDDKKYIGLVDSLNEIYKEIFSP